jgi:hypothetical protein
MSAPFGGNASWMVQSVDGGDMEVIMEVEWRWR